MGKWKKGFKKGWNSWDFRKRNNYEALPKDWVLNGKRIVSPFGTFNSFPEAMNALYELEEGKRRFLMKQKSAKCKSLLIYFDI